MGAGVASASVDAKARAGISLEADPTWSSTTPGPDSVLGVGVSAGCEATPGECPPGPAAVATSRISAPTTRNLTGSLRELDGRLVNARFEGKSRLFNERPTGG